MRENGRFGLRPLQTFPLYRNVEECLRASVWTYLSSRRRWRVFRRRRLRLRSARLARSAPSALEQLTLKALAR